MVVWLPAFHIHPIENAKPLFYTKKFSDFQKYHFLSIFKRKNLNSSGKTFYRTSNFWMRIFTKQECIPVGCVSSAAVAVPCPGGVSGPGGCLVHGSTWSGGVIPACTEADPPPVDRMTDRCKNITFATSLRTVMTTFKNII